MHDASQRRENASHASVPTAASTAARADGWASRSPPTRARPSPTSASAGERRAAENKVFDIAKSSKAPVKCVWRRLAFALVPTRPWRTDRAGVVSLRRKRQSEFYQIVRVRGDGKCMFRSLALGLAAISKRNMTSAEEEFEADQLRLAVAESLCRTAEKRKNFSEAVMAISFEHGLETYCRRILDPKFWGGEPEMLVLSRLIKRPIKVYIHAHQARNASGNGFVCIQTYGEEFSKTKKGVERKAVKLLYNGENHYDLLI